MSATLVVVLVVGVLALVAAGVAVVLSFVGRRRRRVQARLDGDLAIPAVRGPENARYRSGSGQYPRAGGNGKLLLTRGRLVFRIMIGTDVVVPLEEITAIREAKTFKNNRAVGRTYLVVTTESGEMGFLVHDTGAWVSAIEQAAPQTLVG